MIVPAHGKKKNGEGSKRITELPTYDKHTIH